MPLIQGKSERSFDKNISSEMHAGKPLKQSLAIAYAMKKKANKMAMGGACYAHGKEVCPMCDGGRMAEGGFIEEEKSSGYRDMPEEHPKMDEPAMEESDRMLNQHGEEEVAAEGMEEDDEPQHERMVSHPVENQSDREDMVGRIMKKRQMHYSEGGKVANDAPLTAGFDDAQYDDLVKRDDLEQHYTGANSGDELDDEQENHDRKDIVARIMRSRRMKDRMPSPA